MLKSNQFHMQFCFGVVRVGSQSSITKEKCGDTSDSYTEKRVSRFPQLRQRYVVVQAVGRPKAVIVANLS